MKMNKKLAIILAATMLVSATSITATDTAATAEGTETATNTVVDETKPAENKEESSNNGAVGIVAGRTKTIRFVLKENVKGSIAPGRRVKLTLSNPNVYFMFENGDADVQKILKDGEEFVQADGNGYSLEAIWEDSAKQKSKEIILTIADIIPASADRIEIEIEAPVYVPVSEKNADNVKIQAEVRGTNVQPTTAVEVQKPFTEEVKQTEIKAGLQNQLVSNFSLVETNAKMFQNNVQPTTAVEVQKPFTEEVKQTEIKAGLQNQLVSNFSLVETNAKMFQKGEIKIDFVKSGKNEHVQGIKVESIGELVTSGGIKRVDYDEEQGNPDASIIKLNRTSKEAATLTIKDMKLSVDRSTPEGTYDLRISGSAIDEYPDADFDGNKIIIKDFLKVTTQNTQDIELTSGLGKAKVVFTLDSNIYTVNGNEKTMDAKAYIQDPGYTMIPVRYVADALGVKPADILVNGKQVTLFAGNRTIQLTSGSKNALVNGATIQIPVAVVIKEGRTYVPVAELGKILGIKAIWDNTAKTATFEN